MKWFIANRCKMPNYENPWTVENLGYDNHNSDEFKAAFAWHSRNRDREVIKIKAVSRQAAIDSLKGN